MYFSAIINHLCMMPSPPLLFDQVESGTGYLLWYGENSKFSHPTARQLSTFPTGVLRSLGLGITLFNRMMTHLTPPWLPPPRGGETQAETPPLLALSGHGGEMDFYF